MTMNYASRIKTYTTSWGGTVLHAAFPAHGQISIVGSIIGGSRLGGETLAALHAEMLLEGTQGKTKREIQQLIDDWGASLSFSTTPERLVFQAQVSASHAKQLLALIAEVLKDATFPAKEFEYARARERAELSLEAQDTGKQASINITRLLYPAVHPNYTESTAESSVMLEKIKARDLAEYHSRAISTRGLVISFAGDISAAEADALVEKSFAKLPNQNISLSEIAPIVSRTAAQQSVSIQDKASVDVIYGIATGITKDHPDYPALLLGMQVLGSTGGFNGRLMKIVREAEGLTYGTYAFLNRFGASIDGYLTVWATFAPQLLEKGKAALLREARRIAAEGVTTIELKKHAAMYEARSRTSLASSAAFAFAAHWNAVDGRSPRYLDEFPKRVLTLTKREVDAALKKYLVPDLLSESSAGPVDNTVE